MPQTFILRSVKEQQLVRNMLGLIHQVAANNPNVDTKDVRAALDLIDRLDAALKPAKRTAKSAVKKGVK